MVSATKRTGRKSEVVQMNVFSSIPSPVAKNGNGSRNGLLPNGLKELQAVAASGVSAEKISLRAWEIWQSAGCPENCALENWLAAERELCRS